MRLKVYLNEEAGHQDGAALGVGWLNNDTFLSIGDDKQLLQWSAAKPGTDPQPMPNYKKLVFLKGI
jgi:hypothetical protein